MNFRDKSAGDTRVHVEWSTDWVPDTRDEGHGVSRYLIERAGYAWRRFLGLLDANLWAQSSGRRLPCRTCLRPEHVDETEMLAYLDGELSITGTEEVASHLQSCWPCRREMRVIRTRIKIFLADRDAKLPRPGSPSADRIGEFRRKLNDNEQ